MFSVMTRTKLFVPVYCLVTCSFYNTLYIVWVRYLKNSLHGLTIAIISFCLICLKNGYLILGILSMIFYKKKITVKLLK